ncbi:MAG: YdcF family protein [Ferrovum sp.]|nr:YdcF family protein [Ferrovum sp.]NDU88409.1 YdcF family protein [Ferrovum sp.]
MYWGGFADLILPPLVLFWPILWGITLMAQGRVRRGAWMAGGGVALFWVVSTPVVSGFLLHQLMPPYQSLQGNEADAIVILSAGTVQKKAEYGGVALKSLTLERIRYGAWLARRWNKPILVAGGDPGRFGVSESQVIKNVLENEFGVPVRWIETRSNNTRENAMDSVLILKAAGIHRIYLVSHAWHLNRAIPEFERLGMTVIPAGTGYDEGTVSGFGFLPSASGLQNFYYFCHELLGRGWYFCLDRIKPNGS